MSEGSRGKKITPAACGKRRSAGGFSLFGVITSKLALAEGFNIIPPMSDVTRLPNAIQDLHPNLAC
jgi:hypothetical protein